MTWRVEMGNAVPMVAEVLGAQATWKKLTKAGRAAERILGRTPPAPTEPYEQVLDADERGGH